MADQPDIRIKASVEDETDKGLEKAKKNYEKFEKWAASQHGEGSGHFGRVFSDQSTTGMGPLGRGLTAGLSEHLGTGLALGGMAVAGKLLEDMSGKLVAFNEKLRAGELGGADVAMELGKSLPILGSMFSIGENINEMYSHQKQELQDIKEIQEDVAKSAAARLSLSLETAKAHRDEGAGLRSQERANSAIGLRGVTGEQAALDNALADKLDANANAKADAIAKARNDPRLKDANDAAAAFAEKHKGTFGDNATPELLRGIVRGGGGASKDAAELLRLQTFAKSLKEQSDKGLADKLANLDKGAANAQEGHDKQAQENVLLNMEKRGAEATAHGIEVTRQSTEAQAKQAEVLGHVAEAKRLSIEGDIAAQTASAKLDASRKSVATSDADEKAEIERQLQEKLGTIAEQGAANLAAADKEAGMERFRAAFAASQAETDAAAAANAQRLREAGQGYDAERALRLRELQRAKDEIDRNAEESIKKNSDNASAIRAKATADKAKLDTQNKEQERQAREGEIAGRFGVGQELAQGRIDALKGEAKFGNLAAAAEGKRLEITKEFAAKREELNKLIRDPKTDAAAKAEAQRQLAGLTGQEARAQQFANFTGAGGVPGLNITRGSGASARAREENSPFIALQREIERQNKATAAHTAALDRNTSAMQVQQGKQALAGV